MSEVVSKLRLTTDASLESKQTTENLKQELVKIKESLYEHKGRFLNAGLAMSCGYQATKAEQADYDLFTSEYFKFDEIYKFISKLINQTKVSNAELNVVQEYINSFSKKPNKSNKFIAKSLTEVTNAMETLKKLLTECTALATATKTFSLKLDELRSLFNEQEPGKCFIKARACKVVRCDSSRCPSFSRKLFDATSSLQDKIVKTNAPSYNIDDVAPFAQLVESLKGNINDEEFKSLNNEFVSWLEVVNKTQQDTKVKNDNAGDAKSNLEQTLLATQFESYKKDQFVASSKSDDDKTLKGTSSSDNNSKDSSAPPGGMSLS